MNFIYAVKCFSSDVIILITTENNQKFFLFPFPQNFCKFWNESTKLYGTRALVPYVSRAPLVLVLHVPRLLRALVPHVLLALRAPMTYVLRALRFLVLHAFCALRALVPHMSYVIFYLTCLVPCVFSYCSCLILHVLLCSSSLPCFRCFKPNILICILCLVAFMSCTSCAFHAWAIGLIIVICHSSKRNAITMVFGISDISLQDPLSSLH